MLRPLDWRCLGSESAGLVQERARPSTDLDVPAGKMSTLSYKSKFEPLREIVEGIDFEKALPLLLSLYCDYF